MDKNISLCNRCLLWSIQEDNHLCPLAGVNYVDHCKINGKFYIHRVSKNGEEWQKIKPIPSFMVKEAFDEINGF